MDPERRPRTNGRALDEIRAARIPQQRERYEVKCAVGKYGDRVRPIQRLLEWSDDEVIQAPRLNIDAGVDAWISRLEIAGQRRFQCARRTLHGTRVSEVEPAEHLRIGDPGIGAISAYPVLDGEAARIRTHSNRAPLGKRSRAIGSEAREGVVHVPERHAQTCDVGSYRLRARVV